GCMLNQSGGILDDLIVYYRAPDNYRLVFNAATREKVLSWLKHQAEGVAVGIQERADLAMIAIQGPRAVEITCGLLPPRMMDVATTLQHFGVADLDDWFIARTGYTGEDGFEIMLPHEPCIAFWRALQAAGVQVCGLGARDSLRLEAGLL